MEVKLTLLSSYIFIGKKAFYQLFWFYIIAKSKQYYKRTWKNKYKKVHTHNSSQIFFWNININYATHFESLQFSSISFVNSDEFLDILMESKDMESRILKENCHQISYHYTLLFKFLCEGLGYNILKQTLDSLEITETMTRTENF